MGKQIVASLGGLITRRSNIVWIVLVVHFALVANHHRSPSSVEAAATVRATDQPEIWRKKLSQYVRIRDPSRGCPASMDVQGLPSEETLVQWESQYSPSQWSVRYSPVEVVNHHVAFVTEESARNRDAMETRLDIEYGSGDRDKVDIYGDDLPADAPLFVYIHGGYWQMLDKETSAYPAKPLVDRGIRVMIVGYELCPGVTLEELVRQIQVAGEFVFNYATENGVRHVSIAGHSAGAHLITAMLDRDFQNVVGEEFNLLKDVYLISGVYNVQELRYTQSVNRNNLLGITNANARLLSTLFTNYEHLRPVSDLRFHVYVAQHDSDVFREMSANMTTHLTSFGLRCDLNTLPNLDHFDIVENLSSPDHAITKAILEGVARAKK